MKFPEDFGESIIAVIVSAAAAIVGAACTMFIVIVIGGILGRLISDEMGYGLPLFIYVPCSLIAAVAIFIAVFRKMGSL